MSGGGALWETWGPVDSIYSQQQHLHGCTFSRGPRPNLGRRVCVTVNSQEVIPGSLVRKWGNGIRKNRPSKGTYQTSHCKGTPASHSPASSWSGTGVSINISVPICSWKSGRGGPPPSTWSSAVCRQSRSQHLRTVFWQRCRHWP